MNTASEQAVTRSLFALGLASLALLPAWDAVTSLPGADRGWAAWGWLAGATAVLAAAVRWRPRQGPAAWALGLPLAFLLGLMLVDTAAFLVVHLKTQAVVWAGGHYLQWRKATLIAMPVAAVMTLMWMAWRGWRASLRTARHLATQGCTMLAALPLVFSASYLFAGKTSDAWSPSAAAAATPGPRHTTVVLIFDELDDRVLAQHIDRLPHLRRLQRKALSASSMYPPANYTTESLPGMLSGGDYDYTSYTRSEIHVQAKGSSDWLRLSSQSTLLSDAVSRGEKVDVIGWHLPYCSVFKGLRSCWDDAAWRAPGSQVPLPVWLHGHSRMLGTFEQWQLRGLEDDLSAYSKAFFGAPSNYRLRRIGEIFEAQSQRLLQVLALGDSDLVFAHLTCPHPPSMAAAEVDTLDVFEAYAQNLTRCDQLLGQVQSVLAQRSAGHALILTSDHWFRALDWQAQGKPLVVPRQRETVPFYVQLNDADGSLHSTNHTANTRLLPKLVAALSQPARVTAPDYGAVRRLIEAETDSETRLRKF